MDSLAPPSKQRRVTRSMTADEREPKDREKTAELQTCHIDALSDDCLLDIFTRLDLNEMDEIAVLNPRMNRLAAQARPRAIKGRAEQLRLDFQWLDSRAEKTCFTVIIEFERKTVEKTFCSSRPTHTCESCEVCKELVTSAGWELAQFENSVAPALHSAFEFAARASQRFSFAEITFGSFVNFAALEPFFFRFLVPDDAPDELVINPGILDDVKSFWAWIVAVKPEAVEITFGGETSLILELECLDRYSKSVDNPSITLCAGYGRESSTAPNNPEALEIFSRFEKMNMEGIRINPNRLLELVMARLQTHRKGVWNMATTREIVRTDIVAALDPTMQGRLLVAGDKGYCKTTVTDRFVVHDSNGRRLMLIDLDYRLVDRFVVQAGGLHPYGCIVSFHFY